MKKFCIASFVAAGLLAAASGSHAADTVKKLSGGSVQGTIKTIGRNEVSIELRTGTSETIPTSDIESIVFDGEPPTMRNARSSAERGSYSAALASLEKLDVSGGRPELQQDIQYYKALCHAGQALASGDKLVDAGKEMVGFVTQYPDSYHSLAANEKVGDLLVAVGKPDLAMNYYNELLKSPSAEAKLRGGVALGRALTAQKKYAEALASFDGVLKLAEQQQTPAAMQQKFAATLGKATCLANENKADEGVTLVEGVINQLPAEDSTLQAQAYLTLGDCYLKKPDAKKQALLAFLHIDVLYPNQVQAESAALRQLAMLWNELGKPDRAADATQRASQLKASGGQ